jgi:hypothetical protein
MAVRTPQTSLVITLFQHFVEVAISNWLLTNGTVEEVVDF